MRTEKTFTITNSGGVSATGITGSGLAAPFTYKGGSYPGTAGTCSGTILATASCTVVVTFTPSALGLASSSLDLNFNDGAAAQVSSRPVQGTGVGPATLAISDGATYDFGSRAVGSSTDKTFTVTNTGSFTATALTSGAALTAPYSFKGGTYPGTTGTCAASLAPAGTCTVGEFDDESIGKGRRLLNL